MTEPRISIITPSYNQADFLEATIQSVLTQDYPAVEYLIVDGGSTDGSADIIRRYAAHLAWWVSEPDQGQADAIRKGLARATGEVLAWLNSDDVYLSAHVLSRVAACFRENPQAAVVTGEGQRIDGRGRPLRDIHIPPAWLHPEALRYRNAVLQPATFIRRGALEQVHLDTSLHYAFDWDLWIQLARQGAWLHVPEAWAGYRWWGENKTARGDSRRTREQAEVVRRYLGARTWQYAALRLFAALYAAAERLPTGAEVPLKGAVKTFSLALSKITRRKIPVV
ncbi:MAG: hypothetical protein Fur0018_20880 [Anaerolineales bacterium]